MLQKWIAVAATVVVASAVCVVSVPNGIPVASADPGPELVGTTTQFVESVAEGGYTSRRAYSYPPESSSGGIDQFSGAAITNRSVSRSYDASLPTPLYTTSNGFLRFDTSALPDNAVVVRAVVGVPVLEVSNADGRSLTADWYNDFPVDVSDYSGSAQTSALSGFPLSDLQCCGSSFTFNYLELQNLGMVSLTGSSGLRFHIDGGQPTGRNHVEIAWPGSSASGVAVATLSIEYFLLDGDPLPSVPACQVPGTCLAITTRSTHGTAPGPAFSSSASPPSVVDDPESVIDWDTIGLITSATPVMPDGVPAPQQFESDAESFDAPLGGLPSMPEVDPVQPQLDQATDLDAAAAAFNSALDQTPLSASAAVAIAATPKVGRLGVNQYQWRFDRGGYYVEDDLLLCSRRGCRHVGDVAYTAAINLNGRQLRPWSTAMRWVSGPLIRPSLLWDCRDENRHVSCSGGAHEETSSGYIASSISAETNGYYSSNNDYYHMNFGYSTLVAGYGSTRWIIGYKSYVWRCYKTTTVPCKFLPSRAPSRT